MNPKPENQEGGVSVVIGRCQPFHRSHAGMIEQAGRLSDHTFLFLGSCNRVRTEKNPWTFAERKRMIEASMRHRRGKISVISIDDFDDIDRWVDVVKQKTHAACDVLGIKTDRITLVGHQKDDSSFYLNEFPEWNFFEIGDQTGISSTQFRESYFAIRDDEELEAWINESRYHLPLGTITFLRRFYKTAHFSAIERKFSQ